MDRRAGSITMKVDNGDCRWRRVVGQKVALNRIDARSSALISPQCIYGAGSSCQDCESVHGRHCEPGELPFKNDVGGWLKV
jgi:hypothetical protein